MNENIYMWSYMSTYNDWSNQQSLMVLVTVYSISFEWYIIGHYLYYYLGTVLFGTR